MEVPKQNLNVFNLSRERPAIFSAFEQGRQRRQQRDINQQNMQANEIALENARTNQLSEQDQARLSSIVDSALILQTTPESRRISVLEDRINQVGEAGIPTEDLEEMRDFLINGDVESYQQMVDTAAGLKDQIGGRRRVQSSVFTEIKDENGRTVPAQAITYSNGETEIIPFSAPDGFSIPEAETAQEKRVAQFQDYVARQQVETQEAATRAFQNAIAAGEASDMATAKSKIIPASNNIRKAEQLMLLLDNFETGGFSQGFQNTIQNFFGVRPATEEEAENLMNAQALALLANFTGAISEGEREFVVQMAPNFGLSTEGNRRLLNNIIEDANIQLQAGDAAMGGRDAYNSYLRSRTQARVTEQDIIDEFGEDRIAAAARERGMTREELIQQAIQERQAELQ